MVTLGSWRSLWPSPTSNIKGLPVESGFWGAADSLGVSESENSLLIFGSVNVERLRTRISMTEEKPSTASQFWVTLLAQPNFQVYPSRARGSRHRSGANEGMATDNHFYEGRF